MRRITFTHEQDARAARAALQQHGFDVDPRQHWQHVVSVEATTPERRRLALLLGARHGGTVEHGGDTRGSTLPPEHLADAAHADRVFITFEWTEAQEQTLKELGEHGFDPVQWVPEHDGATHRYSVYLPDPETPERHRLALHLCHEHGGTAEHD